MYNHSYKPEAATSIMSHHHHHHDGELDMIETDSPLGFLTPDCDGSSSFLYNNNLNNKNVYNTYILSPEEESILANIDNFGGSLIGSPSRTPTSPEGISMSQFLSHAEEEHAQEDEKEKMAELFFQDINGWPSLNTGLLWVTQPQPSATSEEIKHSLQQQLKMDHQRQQQQQEVVHQELQEPVSSIMDEEQQQEPESPVTASAVGVTDVQDDSSPVSWTAVKVQFFTRNNNLINLGQNQSVLMVRRQHRSGVRIDATVFLPAIGLFRPGDVYTFKVIVQGKALNATGEVTRLTRDTRRGALKKDSTTRGHLFAESGDDFVTTVTIPRDAVPNQDNYYTVTVKLPSLDILPTDLAPSSSSSRSVFVIYELRVSELALATTDGFRYEQSVEYVNNRFVVLNRDKFQEVEVKFRREWRGSF